MLVLSLFLLGCGLTFVLIGWPLRRTETTNRKWLEKHAARGHGLAALGWIMAYVGALLLPVPKDQSSLGSLLFTVGSGPCALLIIYHFIKAVVSCSEFIEHRAESPES